MKMVNLISHAGMTCAGDGRVVAARKAPLVNLFQKDVYRSTGW